MQHAHHLGHKADARLLAISAQFDRHAVEKDRISVSSNCTPLEEEFDEICLSAVGTALIEAAIEIRHRTRTGRAAKERMLAHIERWSDGDSVPYDQDHHSLGGRLFASLAYSVPARS